jgi:hypothetical protein
LTPKTNASYFKHLDVDSFVSALEGSFAIRAVHSTVGAAGTEVVRLERRGPGPPQVRPTARGST